MPLLLAALAQVVAHPPTWATLCLTLVPFTGLVPTVFPSTPVITGASTMAYLSRTIRLEFNGETVLDGVTVDLPDGKTTPRVLPNLGENVWVVIRNPMLMPQSILMPKTDVAVDANGRPVDTNAALDAGAEVIAGLIVDWNLTDVMSLDDDAPTLPVPTSKETIRDQVPSAVGDVIAALIARARNPR